MRMVFLMQASWATELRQQMGGDQKGLYMGNHGGKPLNDDVSHELAEVTIGHLRAGQHSRMKYHVLPMVRHDCASDLTTPPSPVLTCIKSPGFCQEGLNLQVRHVCWTEEDLPLPPCREQAKG